MSPEASVFCHDSGFSDQWGIDPAEGFDKVGGWGHASGCGTVLSKFG